MTNHRQYKKILRFIFSVITLCICFETLAAPPPPGVPKKNVCNKNLTIVTVADVEFGTFDGTTAGSVTVTPSGSRTSTGPVLVGGTVNAAAFDVTSSIAGCDYWPVRIQIQGVPTDLTGPGTTMPSDVYISSPTGPFTLSPTPGTPTRINVGATLTTNPAQTSGYYTTAAPFTMRLRQVNP